MHSTSIRVDATKILSPRELAALLYDLHRKAPRSANTWLNLILVRLSCCCGLRVSEIAGLRISDIRVEPSRPQIRIRRGEARGGRSRMVPQWWDSGILSEFPSRTSMDKCQEGCDADDCDHGQIGQSE